MSEHETLREIAATLARVDERTQHILAHQAAQNGKVNKHDERIDHHDVELARVKGSVLGLRSNMKIYAALGVLGLGGATQHESIASLLRAILSQ